VSATCPDCGCGYDVPALDGWRCDACEADALRAALAAVTIERDVAAAKLADSVPKWKHEQQVKQTVEALAERDRARIACGVAAAEDVWFWQGGFDRPESLSCPVVMSADTLRSFVARVAEVATLRARVSELETHVETVADRGTVLTLRASLRAMKAERALAGFAS
jgi:hypothetical protein